MSEDDPVLLPSNSRRLVVEFRSCEGFRMPAAHGGATNTGGRRPKASKGGNRDRGRWGGAARALWRFERDCCRG